MFLEGNFDKKGEEGKNDHEKKIKKFLQSRLLHFFTVPYKGKSAKSLRNVLTKSLKVTSTTKR